MKGKILSTAVAVFRDERVKCIFLVMKRHVRALVYTIMVMFYGSRASTNLN